MLALATAAQILLGRPFYYRFFQAVIHRKRFTTDTLVVLSTSVAYLYSLFTLLFTSSHVQFFEASTSVLTIFTIGEYLESPLSTAGPMPSAVNVLGSNCVRHHIFLPS
jgi:cation transport ATPase